MTKQPTYPDYIGETHLGIEYQTWELDLPNGWTAEIKLKDYSVTGKQLLWFGEEANVDELSDSEVRDIIIENNLVSEDGESLLNFSPFKK